MGTEQQDEFSPVAPGEILAEEFLAGFALTQAQLARALWDLAQPHCRDHPQSTPDQCGDRAPARPLLRHFTRVLDESPGALRPQACPACARTGNGLVDRRPTSRVYSTRLAWSSPSFRRRCTIPHHPFGTLCCFWG